MNQTSKYRFTIISPVYNEEGNVGRLAEELGKFMAEMVPVEFWEWVIPQVKARYHVSHRINIMFNLDKKSHKKPIYDQMWYIVVHSC